MGWDLVGNISGGEEAEVPVTFRGRASTPLTPGRAGTANQNIFAFWNGSASKVCRIKAVAVDLYVTVIKALTVPPPTLRFYRLTAAPASGVLLTKVSQDSALSSDVNIILRGDASGDRVSASPALTATAVAGALTQEYAPRFVTAVGYEMFDRDVFFDVAEQVVRPSEGLLLRLDYNLATSNPITDMWLASCTWTEE